MACWRSCSLGAGALEVAVALVGARERRRGVGAKVQTFGGPWVTSSSKTWMEQSSPD